MKDKIFGVLQRVGRSFMLPIAILPVAGLLLGFGSSFTNATTIQTYGLEKILGDGTILNSLLIIMNKVGSAVFDNLPLIFAVGVAIGMAKKEKEVAALSALIAFFVMNVAINAMLVITGEITADGTIASNVLEGTITSVCGIQSLQMGVSQNRSSKCVIILRRIQICSDHFYTGVHVCWDWNVFCLAGCTEWNLCTWRTGNRKRISGNPDFWYY